MLENENVADNNSQECDNNDNKTECISIDDVSDEDKSQQCEKASPLVHTRKKLSKINEGNEAAENGEEQQIKIEEGSDDEKKNSASKVLDSITPEEL